MDHILENEGNPVPDLSAVTSSSSSAPQAMDVDEDDEDAEALRAFAGRGAAAPSGAELEARVSSSANYQSGLYAIKVSQSIKCQECGKIFKNTALANFHAEKSGHDQFEESTEEVCVVSEDSVAVTDGAGASRSNHLPRKRRHKSSWSCARRWRRSGQRRRRKSSKNTR